jgi:hypothetical protein
MPETDPSAQKNSLLGAMSVNDVARFFPNLHPVSLPLKKIVYDVGAPLEYVYFVEQGVISEVDPDRETAGAVF